MANDKIVGFTIKIDGQKQITQTTQMVGLLNTQFILLNNTLKEVNKSGSEALEDLDKSLKSTSSSSKKLGAVVKGSLDAFEKSNKVVKDLGNGYIEVQEAVQEVAKSDKVRIKQLNALTELTKEQGKELNALLVAQQKQRKLQKERNFLAKQQAVLETEAAGNRKARKAQLALVTAELNKLTEKEQFATKEGKRLTKQQLELTNSLKKAEEAGGSFGRSVGDYAKSLLRADKLANSFRKNLTKVALRLSVGRSVVEGFSNGIRSAAQGLRQLVEEGDGTNKVFNELESSGDKLQATLVNVGTEFLGAFGSGIAKIIDNVSFVISVASSSLIEASESTGFFGSVLRGVGEVLTNFPAIFGGVIAAVKQFAINTKTAFVNFGIQAQIAGEEFLKLGKNIAGFDTSENEKAINRLTNALKRNAFAAKSVGDAYTEGYNETIAAQAEFNAQAEKEVEIQAERAAAVKRRDKASREAAAAEKKRIADEQRALEKLQNDRANFLQQIEAESIARLEIAKDLQKQLEDVQTEGIKDATDKAIAQENLNFQRQVDNRKENFQKLQDLAQEEEDKALALFGENSAQLKAVQDKNDKELLEVSIANDKLVEAEEQAHRDRLLAINQSSEEQKAALQAEADAKALEEQKAIDDQALQDVLDFQAKSIEAEKIAAQEKEALRSQVKDQTINLVQQTFSAISTFVQIANDAETARLQQSIDLRKQSISSLNEELQGATGLQKKFLEQQVKNEEQALEQEGKNKEKALREQANVRKGIAFGEAVVAAALGVANAFTLPPPASFIAAAATGVATAAQIATIVAQKFAKGGKVGANAPQNLASGKISVASNINTQPNGDNVLATVKRGEVILNAEQQAKLGGARVFSSIGVPGFADGGVVGSISTPPNIVTSNSRSDEFIKAIDKKTDAIINTVFDLQVRLDVDQLEDLQDNETNLKALTTLGNG